jgi:hypothetical protein
MHFAAPFPFSFLAGIPTPASSGKLCSFCAALAAPASAFYKKKSLSHDDLRIAPCFFILNAAYRPHASLGLKPSSGQVF